MQQQSMEMWGRSSCVHRRRTFDLASSSNSVDQVDSNIIIDWLALFFRLFYTHFPRRYLISVLDGRVARKKKLRVSVLVVHEYDRKVQSTGIYDEIRNGARIKNDRWFLFYDTLLRVLK